MEVRLVQLMASFIRVGSEYSLARLEFSMQHAGVPAPPVIDRPPDAAEGTLRTMWPTLERQIDDARAYTKQLGRAGSTEQGDDKSAAWLARTVQELDQYARAIRWVLTITGTDD